jgi:hypothetical protein
MREYGGTDRGFDEATISRTILRNPHSAVHYEVRRSTRESRPYFGLHDFQAKSFTVSGGGDRPEYITLEGAKELFDPLTTVSHSFKNLDVLFDVPGYYNFNDAVFIDVTFSKKDETLDAYRIVQKGLTIDIHSLAEFHKLGLLFPCTKFLSVLGEESIAQITVKSHDRIEVYGTAAPEVAIPLDLSVLSSPVTIAVSSATEERPLIVIWAAVDLFVLRTQPPLLRLDVSQVQGEDAFVKFTGRKWTGSYHNMSESFTVVHGQKNIHIEAGRDRDGNYVGQPPHVVLEGEGDYYINGIKQTSPLSLGNHGNDTIFEDTNWGGLLVIGIVIAVVIAIVGLLGRAWCCPRNEYRRRVYGGARVERRWEDEMEISHFLNIAPEDELEVQ